MSKKPNSALDYTPRRPAAIAAANRRPMDRCTHGVVQHKQRYPIFEVTAGGKTVEWTDIRAAGHGAFAAAQTFPKQLVMVHEDGRRVLLEAVDHVGNRLGAPVALAA
jgi:hypothetical protein